MAGVEQTVNDVYDLEDRLTTSTRTGKTVTLAYDGDGNRTRKDVNVGGTTTATRYVVDDRTPSGYAQVIEEWQSVNGGAWSLARKYTYGLSRIRQERLSGGAVVGTEYYGYDGHGNVALLTDAAGTVGNTYSYDAYGVLLSQGGNTPNHYQYSGEQWDSDLGMYYLRARYLNPQSGRFWTMDTFEGDSSTPLSLHKYLYAHANPVNGIDPSGHEFSALGVSVSMGMSQGFHTMYDGIVSAFGTAARATLFGAMAGKSMNEVLTEFILEETGLDTVVSAVEWASSYFQDPEEAAILEDLMWRAEVIAHFVMAIPDDQYGDFDIEFEPQCFVGGTLISTEAGQKPIEAIMPGDMVWAWNDQTDTPLLRPVIDLFSRERDEIWEIRVGQDTLRVTGEHPFLLAGKGWTAARDIKEGDEMFTIDLSAVCVESNTRLPGTWRVYNFEVETDHNYYVGLESVLAHNRNNAAFRALMKADKWFDAHHIVAKASKYKGAKEARGILRKLGVGIDTKVNGVDLPRTVVAKNKLVESGQLAKRPNVMTHHGSGLHSHAKMDKVLQQLQDSLNGADLSSLTKGQKKALRLQVVNQLGKIRISINDGTF